VEFGTVACCRSQFFHTAAALLSWRVFALLAVSVLAVGFDAGVLVAGGLLGHVSLALQLSRLYEVATTGFGAVLPYALWATLPPGSGLRAGARILLIAGIVVAAFFLLVAFTSPGLFVSVTEQAGNFGVAYSSAVGRGLEGALFPVRDAALALVVVAGLVIGIGGITRGHITGANILIVVGIVIGTVNGSSALYANFAGTYPGPLADVPFSRVSLSITIFTILATAAYVLHYVGQSRRLDAANRELEHRQKHLAFLAYHNELTQMPNKQALFRDVDSLLGTGTAPAGGPPENGVVAEAFLCDLDSFSSLEDSYGFSFSLALLRRVGRRLEALLSGSGAGDARVYHIEGDRFGVLVPRAISEEERGSLERTLVREISSPVDMMGQEVFLGAGIGHCSVASDAGDAEEVLRRLKQALATAGESPARVGRYSPELSARVEATQALVQDLRRAIREDDFEVHYQPIVDREGRVCSAEALIRWSRTDTGRFIALAEQSGLIVPITEFVVRTVCADLVRFRAVLPELSVHINISARHITQIGFPFALERCAAQWNLDVAALGVEITETSFLREDTEVAATLGRIRAAGFSVAIDDFGTGYSSLSYLKQIPASTLKIDQSFIRGLPDRHEDRALVDAVVTLAHDLGKRVIAEGVETAAQVEYLLETGIDCLQGYHFARPIPADRFADTVAAMPLTHF
jgi:predicted signal transduction protein with EAL and GGDEF domain